MQINAKLLCAVDGNGGTLTKLPSFVSQEIE